MIAIRPAGMTTAQAKNAGSEVVFTANVLTLPRVGEHLVFDPENLECRITVTVTDIFHEFLVYNDIRTGHRTFIVETTTIDTEALEKLRDNATLKRWAAEFDMIEV